MADSPKKWPGAGEDIDDLGAFFRNLQADIPSHGNGGHGEDRAEDDDPEALHALLDELVEELQRDSVVPEPDPPPAAEANPAAPLDPRSREPLSFPQPPDYDDEDWAASLPDSSMATPWPDPSAPDAPRAEPFAAEDSPAANPPPPVSSEPADAVGEFLTRTPWGPAEPGKAEHPQPDSLDPESPDESAAPAWGAEPASAAPAQSPGGPAAPEPESADSLEEFAASLLDGGVTAEPPAAPQAPSEPPPPAQPTAQAAAPPVNIPEPEVTALWTPRPQSVEPLEAGPAPTPPAASKPLPPDTLTELVAAIDEHLAAIPFEAPAAIAPNEMRRREAGRDFIVFSLGKARYAIAVNQVTELDEVPHYTFVPNVPDFVLGVANLRGDVISVLDLRRMLGLEDAAGRMLARMLVVRVGDEELISGLVVDAVHGIAAIPHSDVEPPAPGDGENSLHLEGVAGVAGNPVNVLDLAAVFEAEEVRRLVDA